MRVLKNDEGIKKIEAMLLNVDFPLIVIPFKLHWLLYIYIV
jgi:hypothetical protein